MKKVLSNNIATGVRQPYTKVTHEWYNAMMTEAVEALGKGLIGTGSSFTVLYGCVNSDSPDADISAGAIFYNGEIYLCPAFVDATITNDIVGTITTAYDSSDPILFSDGSSYNVHQVKTIVWSDAVSGSGDIDYADVKIQNGTIKTVIPIGDWDMDANPTKNVGWTNVDAAKVISVKAVIRDDANTFFYPLDMMDSATFVIQGGAYAFFTNQVQLVRLTGGYFDSVDFNSTGYSRGHIIVEQYI